MKFNKTDADLRDMSYEDEKYSLLRSVEISVEISESNLTLDEVIEIVQTKYPGFYFDRTEARYDSCVMAVFEYQP